MDHAGLYIQLFSIHGLIRGESPELGCDADTGGQVKYVLELARYLGEHPAVGQVDLITRIIHDKKVSGAAVIKKIHMARKTPRIPNCVPFARANLPR